MNDGRDNTETGLFPAGSAFTIAAPDRQTAPVVFASPHSGKTYPAEFLRQSRLDPVSLRRSEDAFVDELFAQVPGMGAPLIAACFPRVYVDANRESNELDPAMFIDDVPPDTNSRSPRVAAGLGVIARIVSDGQEIYAGKLSYADARRRIEQCYVPYHRALRGLVDDTVRRFGICLVVDCHSMPTRYGQKSGGGPDDGVDLVLGDCWGSACRRAVSDMAERAAQQQGLRVERNAPYAGGYTTRHYGRPSLGVHAIQLEVARSLYMDETSLTKLPAFDAVRRKLTGIALAIADVGRERLAAE